MQPRAAFYTAARTCATIALFVCFRRRAARWGVESPEILVAAPVAPNCLVTLAAQVVLHGAAPPGVPMLLFHVDPRTRRKVVVWVRVCLCHAWRACEVASVNRAGRGSRQTHLAVVPFPCWCPDLCPGGVQCAHKKGKGFAIACRCARMMIRSGPWPTDPFAQVVLVHLRARGVVSGCGPRNLGRRHRPADGDPPASQVEDAALQRLAATALPHVVRGEGLPGWPVRNAHRHLLRLRVQTDG